MTRWINLFPHKELELKGEAVEKGTLDSSWKANKFIDSTNVYGDT